jgi:PAS domain S-box-containing protein
MGDLSQIENTVQQLESYIKDFWRFLPLPICYLNPMHLIFDVDQKMQDFSGYNSTEIIGELIDLLFVNQEKELAVLKQEVLQKGLVNAKRMLMMTKSKNVIPVNLFAMARRDENNDVIGYFLALADIRETEKMQATLEYKVKERTKELEKSKSVLLDTLKEVRQAQEKAETEQNKTTAIINNYIDPIIVVDKVGKVNLFNPAAKEILKINDSVLGQKISKVNNYSLDNFRGVIGKSFQVKSSKELKIDDSNIEEAIIKSQDGESIYKIITAKVIGRQKEYLGTMKIFFNLTREKMIDRLKSEFISIAAHQLRTPLSAIKWAIKIVLDGECGALNQEQKEMLSKGYDSNERIIRLVNDMLDASRIEEGRFGYSFTRGKIDDALTVVLSNLDQMIKERCIKVKIDKPADLPTVLLDKDKIILVLQNILENAVKYTPANGKIEVNIKQLKNDLVVRVKDNGVGIPPEDQSKLFSKFFRANNVIRMQTEGSGLGLFICKNIIEAHGGEIRCKSQEGKGTEFVFSLPLKLVKALKS